MFLKNKRCRYCVFSKYHKGGMNFGCHLNPFKPVMMGLFGTHGDRKRNKKNQYPKKKKDS